MAKLSRDLTAGTLHPREDLFITGNIAAVNGTVTLNTDGCSSLTLDLRGTAVLTVTVEGTVDNTNWAVIPMRPINQAAIGYTVSIVYPVGGGVWSGSASIYSQVRVRCTAYTSGSVAAVLSASTAPLDDTLQGMVTPAIVTVTAAAGAIATLTIPNPGAGLRNYITYVSINRFASALLVAAATPVLVTTTNLPGALVFSFPADGAAQGTMFPLREDFAFPLASSAQNAATTIVGPATANVIWRITAGYYVAP
jgi:hypothetical protein